MASLFYIRSNRQKEMRKWKKDIIDAPVIDRNLDSYEQFFDHDWAKRMFETVQKSCLKDAVDTLMVAWRSSDGAHRLPWLMIHILGCFAKGGNNGSLEIRNDYFGEFIKRLVDEVEAGMNPNLNHDQRGALKRVIAKIEKKAFHALKAGEGQVDHDVKKVWAYLAHNSEFQFSILGTQRINYSSLFFAYEDFLANVIRAKEPTYSSKDRNNPIHVAFPRHFGAALADFCWNHEEVILARLVRNALAHNGGRFGTDLEPYRDRFVDATGTTEPILRGNLFILVDEKIQIAPDNTRHLFGVLKERATKIVEEVTCCSTLTAP